MTLGTSPSAARTIKLEFVVTGYGQCLGSLDGRASLTIVLGAYTKVTQM